MKTVLMADPVRYPRMNTQELRETFLVDGLHQAGAIQAAYVDVDRAIAGIAAPLRAPLVLPTYPELRASFFTERRELGALNIGGPGVVHVGNRSYPLDNLDLIYIGRDNADVRFESLSVQEPAVFYLLSYPAHAVHPVTLVRKDEAQPTEIGTQEACNRRTIYKYIHLAGARSCQLVMGDAPAPGKRLEYHAGAYAYAPFRDLFLLRCCGERAHLPFHGTTARDPASAYGQP